MKYIAALIVIVCVLAATESAQSAVAWYADHETGDASQWDLGITTNWDDSGCTFHGVVGGSAPSKGNYSMRMTVDSRKGKPACRQAQLTQSQTGNTYVYEASYYLGKKAYPTKDMWNVFQFKSAASSGAGSDPMFTIGFERNPIRVVLNWKGGNTGLAGPFANSGVVPNQQWVSSSFVPIGKWTTLRVLLDQSTGFDGHITVWHDGMQLFDFANVRTGYASGDMRWSVNNYTNGLSVNPYTLWIDDATIETPAEAPPPPPPPPGEPAPIAGQGYHQVFADEFTTLDRSVWDNRIWYDDPPDPAWTGFQQVDSSGVLHLRTSRNFFWGTGANDNWPINTITTHSSARTFQYGYFEARMNWTGAPGSWPAFWLLSQGWANTGSCTTPAAELDVMEGQGTEPNVLYGTIHQDASGSGCKSDLQNGNNWQPMGFRLADGWHTYGALWTPSLVSWYVDGQFVHSAVPYADFNQPMFLLLQEWVGGWTSDSTSQSPDVMENAIDWVHVWQK